MPALNLSDISITKLRGYREFAFQPDISKPSHRPFFSLENYDTWATISGYELYETWLKNAENISQNSDHGAHIERATARDIKQFRDTIMQPVYAEEDYFSTDNFHNWIRPVAFEAWMTWFKLAVKSPDLEETSRPSSRMSSFYTESRPSSRMSDLDAADFTSDITRRTVFPYPPSSRASISETSVNIITISDSDSDENEPPQLSVFNKDCGRNKKLQPELPSLGNDIKRSHSNSAEIYNLSDLSTVTPKTDRKVAKGKEKSLQINCPRRLTSKLTVDSLSTVTSLPSTWAIPRDNSATLVDLSALEKLPIKTNGSAYSMDALIRAEDQDSWRGSAGRAAGDVHVVGFSEEHPMEPTFCRRALLQCNGVDICEYFDKDILKDCERFEPDPDQMQELWESELDANEREALNEANILSRFYTEICEFTCKIPCSGNAIMRKLRLGRSKFGKEYFIGCSAWKPSEQHEHRYLTIPSNVDEDLLSKVMESGGILPSHLNTNTHCVLAVHPRSALQTCQYSHVINGKISLGNMIQRTCPTRMAIFVPVDTSIQKAIVYMRNPHNHPMYPKSKPSIQEKEKLIKAINAAGRRGLTVRKLINAPSTSEIYDGVALPVASPAYMDRRKIRNVVHNVKMEDYPQGTGWEGLLHEHLQRESKLPITERYIQAVTVTPEAKYIITMNPRLSKYFHSVLYLCIDYTFKRVKGDIDEWEVVAFLDRFNRRVTLARFYCDRNTRGAFCQLFSELFRIIYEITGSPLKFFAFFPGDPNARLRAIILDAEASQAQGLGDALMVYIAKFVPETAEIPRNSLDLLMMVLKTCSVHFERNIDNLPKPTVSKSTILRLKGFMGLKTLKEIQEWHEFCKNSQDKSVRDWHQQKINNPWFLPSLNAFLSKMDESSWKLTPNHSNLVEGSHSGTNEVTSIGKEIGEAVMSARELDNNVANELEAVVRNAIMPKRWNGPLGRDQINRQRRTSNYAKQKNRDEKLSLNDEYIAELQELTSQSNESLVLDKSLQLEIKKLREGHDIDRKARIKELQEQVECQKEKRRGYKQRRLEINKLTQELKDSGLSGTRVNGRRPPHSASAMQNDIPEDNDTASASESSMPVIRDEEHQHDSKLTGSPLVETFPEYWLPDLDPADIEYNNQCVELETGTSGVQESFLAMLADPNTEYNYNYNPSDPEEQFVIPTNTGNNDYNFDDIDFDNFDFEKMSDPTLLAGFQENSNNYQADSMVSSGEPLVLLPHYSPPTLQSRVAVSIGTGGDNGQLLQLHLNDMPSDSQKAYPESRAPKRKNLEISEADILPEGSRRTRTRSAKALASENV